MAQICNTVLMVEPVHFGFNGETAASNSFQTKTKEDAESIQEKALGEFNAFAGLLESHGIEVLRFRDSNPVKTPDSIFPNNWFNTDRNGLLLTFPMAAENRRAERNEEIIRALQQKFRYRIDRYLTNYEISGHFLEGTGSLVIDHHNELAFAALSPRTDPHVLEMYCRKSGNEAVTFEAFGPAGELIYHTNVMLCIADGFALVGLDTIAENDRQRIAGKLTSLGKELILLSNEQVYSHFAGNALQLQNKQGQKFLVMSQQARNALTEPQIRQIEKYDNLILAPQLDTIETVGGGSARCMLAEIF